MKIIRPFTVVEGSLTSNVPETDAPAYSSTAIYIPGDQVMYATKVYEALLGQSKAVTFTTGNVNWVAHGLAVNTPVSFTTTGSIAGVTVGTIYYIRTTSVDSFDVSATVGGSKVSPSGTGCSVRTGNLGNTPPLSPTYWLDVGASNRWKMFDTSVQSQTVLADVIDVTVALGERIDTLALVNLDAVSVQVIMTDSLEGEVFNQTVNTNSTGGVFGMYTYFFEPLSRATDLVIDGLPPYVNASVQIILTAPGGSTAKCGGCIMGLSLEIGDTEVGVRIGTQDYSIKQRDNFGNYTVLERAFARRANFTVHVDSRIVDKLMTTLATYRATPIVYIGTASYGSTVVYGFYKSFEIEIGYADGLSVCSLEVEGLT